jgi:hypothetical protein
MCCDNPTKLGCVSICGTLILGISVTESYTIKSEFNGAAFNVGFTINEDGHAVIDKSDLNDDYTYTFAVYDELSILQGCYSATITPQMECCDEIEGVKTISDYACFNSDAWLTEFVAEGYEYGYKCIAAKYNGDNVGTGETLGNEGLVWYSSPNILKVPVQESPRDTIAAHTDAGVTGLSYDKNFIDFLNSLPIADFLTFRTSPFTNDVRVDQVFGGPTYENQYRDVNYPLTEISQPINIAVVQDGATYGEGFQIEFKKCATWSFIIECWYRDSADQDNTAEIGHTVVYRDNNYVIDGATIYPANTRTIYV